MATLVLGALVGVAAVGGAAAQISAASQLDCDFERPCRWRNGTTRTDWLVGSAVVLDAWHSIPRAIDSSGLFAYTAGSLAGGTDEEAWLVSERVPCQLGDGVLSFYFWKTAQLPRLDVCVRKPPGSEQLQCFDTVSGVHNQRWLMKTTHIPPINQVFEIVLKSVANHPFDIIGLDQIVYEARICGQGSGGEPKPKSVLRELAKFTQPVEDRSLRKRRSEGVANRLLVTDETLALRRRANSPVHPMIIVAQSIPPKPSGQTTTERPDAMDRQTRPSPQQQLDAGKAIVETVASAAGLYVPSGDGSFSLLDWARQIAPFVPLLLKNAARDDEPNAVAAAPPHDPFLSASSRIVPAEQTFGGQLERIRAAALRQDPSRVITGERMPFATQTSISASTSPPPPPPPPDVAKSAMCDAANCNFDDGRSCAYTSGATGGIRLPAGVTLGSWKSSRGQVANSVTGIFGDASGRGAYVYAGDTDNRNEHFVLSSADFVLAESALVQFRFHLAGVEGRLRVCVRDVVDCPFEQLGKHIRVDARRWQVGSFRLAAGVHSIHFIVDGLKKNYVIGLDDIVLTNVAITGTGTTVSHMVTCQ